MQAHHVEPVAAVDGRRDHLPDFHMSDQWLEGIVTRRQQHRGEADGAEGDWVHLVEGDDVVARLHLHLADLLRRRNPFCRLAKTSAGGVQGELGGGRAEGRMRTRARVPKAGSVVSAAATALTASMAPRLWPATIISSMPSAAASASTACRRSAKARMRASTRMPAVDEIH